MLELNASGSNEEACAEAVEGAGGDVLVTSSAVEALGVLYVPPSVLPAAERYHIIEEPAYIEGLRRRKLSCNGEVNAAL